MRRSNDDLMEWKIWIPLERLNLRKIYFGDFQPFCMFHSITSRSWYRSFCNLALAFKCSIVSSKLVYNALISVKKHQCTNINVYVNICEFPLFLNSQFPLIYLNWKSFQLNSSHHQLPVSWSIYDVLSQLASLVWYCMYSMKSSNSEVGYLYIYTNLCQSTSPDGWTSESWDLTYRVILVV